MSKNKLVLRRKVGKILPTLMFLTFAGVVVTFALMTLVTPTSAEDGDSGMSVNISAPDVIKSGGYYILIEHNESTEITLEDATAFGYYGKNNDSLKVYTNSPSGYQLYISSDQEGDFASDGSGDASSASDAIPGNSLFMDGTLGATEYFGPTTGAYTSPSTAIETGGTAVGSTTSALSGTTSWGFSTSDNDLYAAVPLKNNETLIKKTKLDNSALADTDVSVAQNIYYGAKANLSKAAGTYSGSVLYTAMSDADSTLDGLATITPSSVSAATSSEVTVRTSLFTNMADLGEVAVYIGDYSSTSDTPVAADACTDIDAGIDTDDNNNLVITCNTPAKAVGTYDVLVTVEKFGKVYLISDGIAFESGS